MRCAEIRESLGAFVLGALDADEASQVAAHVAQCPSCGTDHRELAGLAPLLALVSAEQIKQAADPFSGDRLWRGLLERARMEERGRRRRTWLAAAGAAAAAGVLAIVGTALVAGDDPAEPESSLIAQQSLSARDAASGVHAMVAYDGVGWGTSLVVTLGGIAPGEECSLVAIAGDGQREVAASWKVPTGGYGDAGTITVRGAVGFQTSEIDRYEIVTAAGTTLLEIPA